MKRRTFTSLVAGLGRKHDGDNCDGARQYAHRTGRQSTWHWFL